MNITCTIVKEGRSDEYSRPLTVGHVYTGSFDFVKSLWQQGFATVDNTKVFDNDSTPGYVGLNPNILRFTNFSLSILASLVAGATYGQSDSTVTVTATAHGLPTNRDGYHIFWPGSVAIAAGWYSEFAYVNADTYTFKNPNEQTVTAGTAITGSLPYLTSEVITSAVLPGGSLASGVEMRIAVFRGGDSTASSKTTRAYLAGTNIGALALSTQPAQKVVISAHSITKSRIAYNSGNEFVAAQMSFMDMDFSSDSVVDIRGQLAAASCYISIENAYIELVK